ncbi:hypothetical protein V5O48_004227 [Marasmius crinis-equi]|uniref:4-coumarate--CoA ligase n=1 Tax=Marasmius crinis-equi TaxID=585013 RepID=A0ABR3FQQ5_9AGAR
MPWLPQDGLVFCIGHTQSKVLIVDPERADVLVPVAEQLRKNGANAILVLESGNRTWGGMSSWNRSLEEYKDDGDSILTSTIEIHPEDNATIFFTSGTTGLPKGVLSTQRQYLTNIFNVLVSGMRCTLRDGEDIVPPPPGPQSGVLISVPFFHVTGTTSQAMSAIMGGMKIVLMRSWNSKEAVRLINAENVVSAGGVPSMVADLVEVGGFSVESLFFGGAPASKMLPDSIKKVVKGAKPSQGYGATEANSVAVAMAGNDQLLRPTSCGLPPPVNDLLIMNPEGLVEVPTGQVGEVWIRGPNIMKCYWNDPVATDKSLSESWIEQAITKDGWYRTGDLGYLDEEGFLYIKDRLKDIIIRGGENIDSVSIENALYEDPGVLEAAAVGVPDERLGELVAAVVTIKQGYVGKVTEQSLIEFVRGRLPRFAVPVMVIVQTTEMVSFPPEHTPSGKIKKGILRDIVREEWKKRQGPIIKSRL